MEMERILKGVRRENLELPQQICMLVELMPLP